MIVGPVIERFGHRTSMFYTCFCQIIGAVSELPLERFPGFISDDLPVQVTSHTPAQFIVGRMLIYIAVGLVENVSIAYAFQGYHAEDQ